MANAETQQLDSIISSRRALLTLGGAALAGLAFAPKSNAQAAGATFTDNDILNFALNLEYLEAQFYTLAASGQTIDQLNVGIGSGTNAATGGVATPITKGNNNYASCQVNFQNTVIRDYAVEIADEERKHVTYLRNALSTNAVGQPQLDLYNSFNSLGQLLGLPSFDPFASDVNFLIGSYIFEDVGVTAYHGGATLITDKVNVLPAAVGIHAVEANHSGLVRMTMLGIDLGTITVPAGNFGGLNLRAVTTAISGVRNQFAQMNAATPIIDDYGLTAQSGIALNGTGGPYSVNTIFDIPLVTIAPVAGTAASGTTIAVPAVEGNGTAGIGYSRTTAQVIDIVTAGGPTNSSGVTTGGFFPAGLNGHFVAGVQPAATS